MVMKIRKTTKWLDRPYKMPSFKSKRHCSLWNSFDEIWSNIYLWPHKKKEFKDMYKKWKIERGSI